MWLSRAKFRKIEVQVHDETLNFLSRILSPHLSEKNSDKPRVLRSARAISLLRLCAWQCEGCSDTQESQNGAVCR